MVSCPICGKNVNINEINSHLDTCGNSSFESEDVMKKKHAAPAGGQITNLTNKKQKREPADANDEVIEIADDGDEEEEYEDVIKEANSSASSIGSILTSQAKPTSQQPVKSHHQSQSITPPQLLNSTHIPTAKPRQPVHDEYKLLQAQLSTPLAELLRPQTLEEYIGQQHLLGPQGILTSLIKSDNVPSLILWGTPGVGKTTLAKLISKYTRNRFVEINATNSGVADLKKIFEVCDKEKFLTKRKTILFCDEIHRFNKTQQDSFLSYVERGTVTLIGATTENPSFQVNNALLSRCKVFKLEKLNESEVRMILNRGVAKVNKFRSVIHKVPLLGFGKDGIDYLASLCNGDSRIALNFLELVNSYYISSSPPSKLTKSDLQPILQKTYLSYDKSGDFHYDTISAFHKSLRGSNEDGALYYLAKMLTSGENPLYVARRLIRVASEDIGLADESCLPFSIATYNAIEKIGMPECELALVQCTVKFCRAKKSVEIYRGWNALKARFKEDPSFAGAEIPYHLRNAPTKLMKEVGYSKGYKYPPNYRDGKAKQEYLPESARGLKVLNGVALGHLIDSDIEDN